MPPASELPTRPAFAAARRPVFRRFGSVGALALALAWATPGWSQQSSPAPDSAAQTATVTSRPSTASPEGETPVAKGSTSLSGPVAFEADELQYAYNDEVVTATGNVVLRREGQSVRANTVTWNRKTGKIEASGNIRLVDEDGNQLFTDRVELTDELKAGAMQNLLLALRDGGRLAAFTGERAADGSTFRAAPRMSR